MEQTACDRCQLPLEESAAYCNGCGERTHKARRIVRLAIRIEVLFVILVAVMIFGFAAAYLKQ